MTPEPTPSVSIGLSNQSRATALLVMPTTAGPTVLAAYTAGVLRALEMLSVAASAAALDEAAEQPAYETAETTKAAATSTARRLWFLWLKFETMLFILRFLRYHQRQAKTTIDCSVKVDRPVLCRHADGDIEPLAVQDLLHRVLGEFRRIVLL